MADDEQAMAEAVSALTAADMFELMRKIHSVMQESPETAREMLLKNNSLAWALIDSCLKLKIVDPEVAVRTLHKHHPNPVPIQDTRPPTAAPPVVQELPTTSSSSISKNSKKRVEESPVAEPPPGKTKGVTGASKSKKEGPPTGVPPPTIGVSKTLSPPGTPPSGVPAVSKPPVRPPYRQPPPPAGAENDHRHLGVPVAPVPPPTAGSSIPGLSGDVDMRGTVAPPPPSRPLDPRLRENSRPSMPADPRLAARQPQVASRELPQAKLQDPRLARSTEGPPRDPRLQSSGAPMDPRLRNAAGSNSGTSDDEKAKLISQVMNLTDHQISLLPVEQRQSILLLRDQISKSMGPGGRN
ncbi:unnamed protein product [Cyprideis torosa]|uniref:Uncharacterized protein n=1 Tax=Cyprideis torosa TaxID=163714 RepID=A0A7R8W674_9CRUS|nr:unnamed protein product [Cyprideis torosa]CAG0886175.1 unnamed protein product [Cyprideis torosa]